MRPYEKRMLFLSAFILLFGLTSVSIAAHHESQKTSASDVKEEAMETYDALKSYTLEQRNEAVRFAQEKIHKLDVRIAGMQKAVDEKWQDMSKATQGKTRETLDILRKKREDLAEWLGGIRYSSKEAWEDVKKGFSDSYDRMEKAFEQANKDITSDQTD